MILYIAIFAFTTILSLWASYRVKSKFREFSKVRATSGLSGAQAAQRILSAAGINDVQVVPTQGELSDHYDPMNKRLVLCEENYFGQSVAALGVAAHEAGHALQHQAHYKPLHLRMAAVGVTRSTQVRFLDVSRRSCRTGVCWRPSEGCWHIPLRRKRLHLQ